MKTTKAAVVSDAVVVSVIAAVKLDAATVTLSEPVDVSTLLETNWTTATSDVFAATLSATSLRYDSPAVATASAVVASGVNPSTGSYSL
jgi:hypothetical protein